MPKKANGSNLSDFVRPLIPHTPYEEVAEKAKAAGFTLSKGYYYVLKSELKQKKAAAAAKRGTPGKRVKRVNGKPARAVAKRVTRPHARTAEANGLRLTSSNKAEEAVIRAVEEVGLDRIRKVITTIESLFG